MGEPINGLRKDVYWSPPLCWKSDGDLVYIMRLIYRQSRHGVWPKLAVYKLVVWWNSLPSLRRVSDTGMRDLQLMINLLQPNYTPQGSTCACQGCHGGSECCQNAFLHPKRDDHVLWTWNFLPAGQFLQVIMWLVANAFEVLSVILRDRKVLSEDGIFIVAICQPSLRRRELARLSVHTRGFVYLKRSRDILRESSNWLTNGKKEYLQGDDFDWARSREGSRQSDPLPLWSNQR